MFRAKLMGGVEGGARRVCRVYHAEVQSNALASFTHRLLTTWKGGGCPAAAPEGVIQGSSTRALVGEQMVGS